MKKTKILLVAILALFIMNACDNDDDASIDSLEGTYVGTITIESGLKSTFDATAEITKISDEQIQVHCFGSELDTTFMLNYFEHNDSIMVCLTGDDFEHMYGHRYGEGHMSGGMMGDRQNGETEWMHHMSDEHKEGDEHFGGFDMMNHSFGYTFKMTDHRYHFQGTKE
jgi:hypothetical protein